MLRAFLNFCLRERLVVLSERGAEGPPLRTDLLGPHHRAEVGRGHATVKVTWQRGILRHTTQVIEARPLSKAPRPAARGRVQRGDCRAVPKDTAVRTLARVLSLAEISS